MSIILDALKKAEQDRTTNAPLPSATGGPSEPGSKKPQLKNILILLIFISLAILGVRLFFLGEKEDAIPKPIPRATAPVIPNAPPKVDEEKIKNEAIELYGAGNFEESLKKWKLLTEANPTKADYWNNLGVIEKKLEHFPEARKAYEKALEIDPNYAEAHNNYGVLLVEQKFVDEGIKHFNQAIELKTDYSEPFFHLAAVEERSGDKALALFHYEKYLSLSPKIEEGLKNKIEMRISMLKAELGQP